MELSQLKGNRVAIHEFLEEQYQRYAVPDFIPEDPISIPHSYTKVQDVEITAFWTSILSWGLRKTIINKATELFQLMDNAPHDFMLNHEEKDLVRFANFKHRTFQYTDTLYFIDFFKRAYTDFDTLEDCFLLQEEGLSTANLGAFKDYFFEPEYSPRRTRKHVSSPLTKSTCKRINMFLRWMVRSDKEGVDFGLWNRIQTSDLFIPFDVHVQRSAMSLGLLESDKKDWKRVVELTDSLKSFDAIDPIKYDFALFGMGVNT